MYNRVVYSFEIINNDEKWNAGNYSSGIYFCRLTTEKTVLTSKLLLVK
ncbi:MAG TPA: T9SS type A sorting domain-containing protein [Candidatus Marinimicrobia bacterium]|nr:T9SS type A sorting domain-containing protein [Candidatus Neomarinimicrobiota bacterium]